MKNSIRAMLAMIAILPCALFFTACGGEKITAEQANEAFAAAITETGNVSTDYKIELNAKISGNYEGQSISANAKGTFVKTGEAVKNEADGTYNIDAVKVGLSVESTSKLANVESKMNFNYSAGKVGDKFVLVDNSNKDNKVYQDIGEMAQALFGLNISELLTEIMGIAGSDTELPIPDITEIDFSNLALESETMKLDAVKTGDKDFKLTFNGYEIDADMAMKLDGKFTLVIKNGKFASLSANFTMYTPDMANITETTDFTDASIYKTKMISLDGSIKMTYGAQKVSLPSSLTGYTETTVIPTM